MMRLPWLFLKEKALYMRSARSFADYYCTYAEQHTRDATLLNEEINNIFGAIGIFIEDKNWVGIIKLVKSIADFLEAQGYWEELSHAYQDAIEAAERYFWRLFHNPTPQAWHDRIILRSDLGILYFLQGQYQKSKEIIQEALEIARRIDHQKLQALLLGILGNIAITEGQYNQAEELHLRCKDILEKLGDREGVANTLGRLATLAISKGDRGLAERLTNERLSLAREMADLDKEADSLCELGNFTLVNGNHEEAGKFYENSIKIFQKTNNLNGIAWVLDRQAHLFETLGDLPEAEKLYLDKLDMARQMGVQDSILETLQSLASLSVDRNNLQNANMYYEQALEISRILGKLPDIAIALQGLAKVAHLRGDNRIAKELYEESLKIAYECGYPKMIHIALRQLSLFTRKTGDFVLAEKYLLEELSFLSGKTLNPDYARTLSDLGDITAVLGKITESREHYQQALDIYASLDSQVEAGFCCVQLSLIELWDGNTDAAWTVLMQAVNISNQHKDEDLREMVCKRLREFLKTEVYQEKAGEILAQEEYSGIHEKEDPTDRS